MPPKYKTTNSEKEFLRLLRQEYKAPAYAVLTQVSAPVLGADFKPRIRKVDALAIGCWQSRGNEILGFEMKADRGSWMSELKNPQKAEDWAQFCDAWYLMAYKDVVREEEVPKNWGLYEARHGGLILVKKAVKLSPKETTRDLFFNLFQAIICQLHPEAEEAALDRRYYEGKRDGAEEARRHFVEAISDIKATQRASDFAGIERLISNGPPEDRPERIKMAETLIQRFTTWHSLHSTENAIKAIEFIGDGGLLDVSDRLKKIKIQLQGLFNEISEKEKIINDVISEVESFSEKKDL